ncbi:hypothetical protein GDO81_018639 [Engystomops pustulosus]|uniref:Uncharacterized protein n=1 Tax=Engystomops pustulosus TaxID=76066 RepID=A0AAV6ZKY6_ENGPU|nr:hypothetical protein GDO81_018639 [Engystomops pustulosus]
MPRRWIFGALDVYLQNCFGENLVRGNSDVDQLEKIFDVIGLPEEESWPGEVAIPQSAFQYRQAQPLEDIVPDIDDLGKDLLLKCLTFSPDKRITAFSALSHPYFDDLQTNKNSSDRHRACGQRAAEEATAEAKGP